MASMNEFRAVKSWLGNMPYTYVAVLVALTLTTSACLTLIGLKEREEDVVDRGIYYDHAFHADMGPLECSICHQDATDELYDFTMPDHNVCGICHDIPSDAIAWTDTTDISGCNLCHTREDFSVDSHKPHMLSEIIWTHEPHIAAEVACSDCHVDPDRPTRRQIPDATLKQFCMNCHGESQPYTPEMRRLLAMEEEELEITLAEDASLRAMIDEIGMPPAPGIVDLLDCSVCHQELDKDVIPTQRDGRPLPHDNPGIWERVHGREYQANPEFCTQCHVSEEQCDSCHSTQAPRNHTLSWRRMTHGLQATWNRQSCAVCHEEDSCIKCHQSSTPRSHRQAGWDRPVNRHCVSCHYPPERSSCTVCHEDIQHRRASPSPHLRGLFPANCASCHPGGLPHRAPHPLNSTVHCTECHQ